MTKSVFFLHREIMADSKLFFSSFIIIADNSTYNKFDVKVGLGMLFPSTLPSFIPAGVIANSKIRNSSGHSVTNTSLNRSSQILSVSGDMAGRGSSHGIYKMKSSHPAQLPRIVSSTSTTNILIMASCKVPCITMGSRTRYTISPAACKEVLRRLLELNHKIHAEEVAAGLWDKKKGGGSRQKVSGRFSYAEKG